MSKQVDSLPALEGPDRVFYTTGVLLNAEDFQAEQDYHRGRLARALAYAHGSGTVAGLEVIHEAEVPAGEGGGGEEERILIRPGLAIDRLGRLIEVPRSLCLRLQKWYEAQNNQDLESGWHEAGSLWVDSPSGIALDLFIKFVACERGKTPAFAKGPFDAIDAVTASRLRDGYEVEPLIRKETNPGLPENRWSGLGDLPESDRPLALRRAIFDGWRETSDSKNRAGLDPLPEHAAGQDTSDLFLARLILPADEATEGGRPERRKNESLEVRNDFRLFVLSANALAGMLGIRASADTG